MLRQEILIYGGRIDGSIFIFDTSKMRDIGVIKKHDSTIVELKQTGQNVLISVDKMGTVKICKVKIEAGKIDINIS